MPLFDCVSSDAKAVLQKLDGLDPVVTNHPFIHTFSEQDLERYFSGDLFSFELQFDRSVEDGLGGF